MSFGLVAILGPRLLQAWVLLDYFPTALLIAWLAAFQWAVLCWLMEKAGKLPSFLRCFRMGFSNICMGCPQV